MKTEIAGLNKMYTSGDVIKCSLRVTGNERIISSDINLVQKDWTRVQQIDGNTSYVPDTKYTVLSSLLQDVYITGSFRGEIRFKIPDDATNTSQKYNKKYYGYSETTLGIRVIIKYMTKFGEGVVLDHFYSFENKRRFIVSKPKYCLVDKINPDCPINDTRFSMMYRVGTSSFIPGETVDFDVVYIPKTKAKVSSLSVKFQGWGVYNLKVKSNRGDTTALENKNMTKEEEYEYMKNAIDCGLGNKFSLKLPQNLHEDTRDYTVISIDMKICQFKPRELDFSKFDMFCFSVERVFFGKWGGSTSIKSLQC